MSGSIGTGQERLGESPIPILVSPMRPILIPPAVPLMIDSLATVAFPYGKFLLSSVCSRFKNASMIPAQKTSGLERDYGFCLVPKWLRDRTAN